VGLWIEQSKVTKVFFIDILLLAMHYALVLLYHSHARPSSDRVLPLDSNSL
jgi:hypothetical protein